MPNRPSTGWVARRSVRFRVVTIGVVAVLSSVAAGCRIGSPPPVPTNAPPPVVISPSPPSSGPPSTFGPLPSEADVTAALLTAAELPGPGTYTQVSPQTSGAASLGEGVHGCGDNDGPSPGPSVHAQAVFQSGVIGPFVAEILIVTSEQDAVRRMQSLASVVTNCAHIPGELPGGIKVDISIGQLTFPTIGDDTVAFRLTGTIVDAGVGLYAHVVTVRRGGLLVVVTFMQISSPDPKVTEDIVRRALAKAAGRLLGA